MNWESIAENTVKTLLVVLIIGLSNLYIDVDRLKTLADRELEVGKIIHENHEERIADANEKIIILKEKVKYFELKVELSNQ